MTIEYLTSVLLPPVPPVRKPLESEWLDLESRIGTSLPKDYKEFVETYGSGRVDNFITILAPFASKESLRLEVQNAIQGRGLRELEANGEALPHPPFPSVPGLQTDNGDMLYWRTGGLPSEWPVVVNESRARRTGRGLTYQ